MAVQAEADAETEEFVQHAAAERLTYFSDAVVAIAITLLALELPVPHGDTSQQFFDSLQDNAFDYLTFFISFAVVGTHWNAHHRVFRWLIGVSPPVVIVDLAWLLLVVLTPFLTKVLRDGELNAAKFGVYAAVQALLILLFGVMEAVASRRGLFDPAAPTSATQDNLLPAALDALGFVVSIPAFVLINSWAFALWFLLPMVGQRFASWLAARKRGDEVTSRTSREGTAAS